MRNIGRIVGILLILMILIVTPFAFWVFNLDRVAMNPQTYKTALKTQGFYDALLPALIDSMGTSKDADPEIRAASQALVKNMSLEDWALLNNTLLPTSWIQGELDRNINNFFDWIGGNRNTPNIGFNLGPLKERWTGKQAGQEVAPQAAASQILPKLAHCTAAQEQELKAVDSSATKPLCYPSTAELRKGVADYLTTVFTTLGNKLPDSWQLSDQLIAAHNGGAGITAYDMTRFRGFLWLDSRSVILLFLIPIALFSLIIIITIRSAKDLFRWLGWSLILSGLITLMPVPFLSAMSIGHITQESLSGSGHIVDTLAEGMVNSILSGLTLAVLIQVIVVIVVGFIAVAISVLLPGTPPEVTREDVQREQMQLAAQPGGSSPFPMSPLPQFGWPPPQQGSTPTPAPMPTPPPTYNQSNIPPANPLSQQQTAYTLSKSSTPPGSPAMPNQPQNPPLDTKDDPSA